MKSLNQLVLKKACAAAPFVELAPDAKAASLFVIATKVPPAEVDHERSLIGFTPELLPAYVQFAAFCDLIFSVQLLFALIVKLGPSLAMTLPASTSSAVGLVSEVAAELIPSLTSAPTVTEAVFVVLQLPALPLHCALAWLAPMAVASTIAANRERVAFIVFLSPKNLMVPATSKRLEPALSKAVGWYTYKTKTDPLCNAKFREKSVDFSRRFAFKNRRDFRAG